MSDFQRSLQFQGRNLQRQWQEKPLLRMAIWSLCLLLVVHLVMLSMDWREERGEEYRRLAGEWLKLQGTFPGRPPGRSGRCRRSRS